MAGRVALEYTDFSGGLNDDVNTAMLQDNEFSELLNSMWNKGALKKRYGYTKHNGTAISGTPVITGLYEFSYGGGASKEFVTTAGAKIFKDVDGTPTTITGSLTITAGQNNVFTFTTFKDVMIGCNGVDSNLKWTGSGDAAVLGGTPPIAAYIFNKWRYVFLAGISATRNIIRFADLNTYETWTAANTINVDIFGDDYITGLAEISDSLLALRYKSIYRVQYTGDVTATFTVTPLLAGVGCPHQRAFVTVDNIGYFMSSDRKIYQLVVSDKTGGFEVIDLTTMKIKTTLNDINPARVKYTVAKYDPNEHIIIFAVSTGSNTTHNKWIVLDLLGRPKFTVFDSIASNDICIRESSNVPYVYFGNYAGQIYRWDDTVNNDDGSGINWRVGTKWFDFGKVDIVKWLRYLAIEAKQQNSDIYIDVFLNYSSSAAVVQTSSFEGTAGSVWNTAKWNTDLWQAGISINKELYFRGKGKFMKFVFRNSAADEPIEIYRFRPILYITEASKDKASQ